MTEKLAGGFQCDGCERPIESGIVHVPHVVERAEGLVRMLDLAFCSAACVRRFAETPSDDGDDVRVAPTERNLGRLEATMAAVGHLLSMRTACSCGNRRCPRCLEWKEVAGVILRGRHVNRDYAFAFPSLEPLPTWPDACKG